MGTAKKNRLQELENVLLDQIEKLNQDDIASDKEGAQVLIERIQAMSTLANSYISINRLKLDVVKELNNSGGLYENYLGIKDNSYVKNGGTL